MNLHTADIIIKESRESVKDYRGFPAVHFSKLAQLSKNPKFVNVEKKDTDYFVFGRYVEDLFMGEVVIDDVYAVITKAAPTGQLGIYTAEMLKSEDCEKAYQAVVDANEGRAVRSNAETFREKFYDEAYAYYQEAKNAKGKDIISGEDALLATKMVSSINLMPKWAEFVENPKYDIYYQVPLVTAHKGSTLKVLVDILVVDTEENIIYPIDMKTTGGNLTEFKRSGLKYRYDIQGSLYSFVIATAFPGYILAPFEFLVISKFTPTLPKFFTLSVEEVYNGRFGTTTASGFYYKGWEQLIEELAKHEQADFWELPVEFWNPTLKLNLYGDYGEIT